MPIEDIYGIRKKNEVMNDTWGHLKPRKDRAYGGYILYTVGCFGDITCIQTHFCDLPDSPWFYDDLHAFMGSAKEVRGQIYLFLGSYTMEQENKFVGVTRRIEPEEMMKICRLWREL